ncbi:MAG TPA: beta-1,6-N-acetylglucosaminyltransferase [Fimbriimonadaceae bacterium]|nr:beta-1,6-N-acetylglucosaminyltransferase [Fimbriimonadaceae bacterium]
MSLAFFIIGHRDHLQVARLLSAIYHPENHYLIHWDAKSSDEEYLALKSALATYGNVRFLEPRIGVYWGGDWSMYGTEVRAMEHFLRLDSTWTHFINLSGQCFPLIPERELAAKLKPGQSLIERVDPETEWKQAFVEERFYRRYMRIGHRFFTSPIKMKGPGVRPWGCSHFKVLARPAVEYLCGDPEALRIRAYLMRTSMPEETVAATVLFNSPLADSIEPRYRHYIDWNVARPPKVLGMEDLERIERSGAWFCRKMVQGELFDVLEARLAAEGLRSRGMASVR